MRASILLLAVVLMLYPTDAVFGKTFECTEAIQTIFDAFSDEKARVLVVATLNADGKTGTIEVADRTFKAEYQVEGFDRTWRFFTDERQEYGYLFLIQPDGAAAYYDHETSEGEPTLPDQAYFCRVRDENERGRREEDEALRRAETEAEEALAEARNSSEQDAYLYAIQQKVVRSWARPASARPGLECIVRVQQKPGGEVVAVDVLSCNGDEAVVRSIEAAVRKASPLPIPSNPILFERDLRFVFRPEQ